MRLDEDDHDDRVVTLPFSAVSLTPISPLETMNETISRAEEDIRVRVQQLAEPKQRRISLAPVARLPPELLSDIFIRLRDSHVHTRTGAVSSFKQSWITVSLVSSSWREIALATPQLWTSITMLSDELVQESMQRARGLPLKLFIQSDNSIPLAEHFLEIVCGYSGEISALALQGRDVKLTLSYLPLVHSLAENLCMLELGCATGCYKLPEDVLDLYFPKLDILKLVCCVCDQNCAQLPGRAASLRVLTIIGLDSHNPVDQVDDAILTMFTTLGSLQLLEALTLRCALSGSIDAVNRVIPKVRLPSLKSLNVEDRFIACAALSRCLHIPKACRTEIEAIRVDRLSDSISPDLFTFVSSQNPRMVYIKLGGNGIAISVRIASQQKDMEHTLTLSNGRWSTHLDALAEIARLSARAAHICVRVKGRVRRGDAIAVSILCGGAQAVATTFRFEGAPATLGLMADCIADRVRFLPRLDHVSFQNFNMDAAAGADVERWVQALTERKKAGVRIGVDFKRCQGVSQQLRQKLKEGLYWVR